jgi:hypothetical protein
MSRSLPLQADHAPALSGTVEVYDPAMCCPTGLCGPGVDPALLQVARDLRWLEASGVTVHRFGLVQEPQRFAGNPRISGLLQAFGDAALPAAMVNDAIISHGRYPTREEFVLALSHSSAPIASTASGDATGDASLDATADATGNACAPGSGCC